MTEPAQHPARTVTVTATPEAWAQLLAALPHCPCGQLAEFEHRGTFACGGCASSSPRKVGKALDHAPAALAIVDALSPFIPSGTWERGT